MAQLIKLQDYISRYETDLSRYPTQFVRLKKQQWEKMKNAWEMGVVPESKDTFEKESIEQGFLDKVRGWFNKKDVEDLQEIEEAEIHNQNDEQMDFSLSLQAADTEMELKQQFLDQLLRFQMKWASSTIAEKSFVDSMYYSDERLYHFIQRFPDTFLLFYEPIFLLKKAPVELEVLLLTPTEIWCLAFLESEENAAYIGSTDHFWLKRSNDQDSKVLNPALSAGRMEKIVNQLFRLYEVELPIRKAIISRNGYIDYPEVPGELLLLDKRTYQEWFHKVRGSSSPLKMMQLRAAKALLDYCQTSSYRRTEWNPENE
ncbi:NERD domain-containing protein [Lederbergia citrea]|uniref:NERD domain-containing protein n=1 Tax=Lederbergia citrea TaxID=2833581 RepID=A0A942UJV4_9BACI|nr:NERD domain-containing protein [Lederbergia citrea]MBS4202532.1 NERD domain-containing protein [Lederbergia citrea]MBS4222801.1 NERD domain-containing protein [Lederbergia citrea]